MSALDKIIESGSLDRACPPPYKDSEGKAQPYVWSVADIHDARTELSALRAHDNAGWRGLAILYRMLSGLECEEHVALGMATSEVQKRLTELVTLRAENEALRQRVSDLISDANGREIDMNKMRHRDAKSRESLRSLATDLSQAFDEAEHAEPVHRRTPTEKIVWAQAWTKVSCCLRGVLEKRDLSI